MIYLKQKIKILDLICQPYRAGKIRWLAPYFLLCPVRNKALLSSQQLTPI